MNNKKISVVTPSFNQGQYLEETIDSVLSQGYKNLEYIVIDGGSSDKSVEIIKKYAKYLHFWISEPDDGHYDALNKGFKVSTGEVMSWINSDDIYFPWALRTVDEIFSLSREINWLTGLATRIDRESRIERAPKVRKNLNDFLIGNYKWIQQESTFWSRELWDVSGGFITDKYKLMIDGELWSRFFRNADLWHVDLSLGAYRLHGNNRAILNETDVKREMEEIIENLRLDVNSSIFQIIFRHKVTKNLNKVLRLLGLKDSPFPIEQYNVISYIENEIVQKIETLK